MRGPTPPPTPRQAPTQLQRWGQETGQEVMWFRPIEQAHGAAGVLGTGCRARGGQKSEHPDHSPQGWEKMLREKSRAKGTILGGTSWPGIFQSRQAEGPGRLLAAKWQAETAGGCLTREAEGGKDEVKGVVVSRDKVVLDSCSKPERAASV